MRIIPSYKTSIAGTNKWMHSGWINQVWNWRFIMCNCVLYKSFLVGTGFSTADSNGGYGNSPLIIFQKFSYHFGFLQSPRKTRWLMISYVDGVNPLSPLWFSFWQLGFLSNLVKVFPSLAKRPFYLTGESYAGHFIVRLIFNIVSLIIDGFHT